MDDPTFEPDFEEDPDCPHYPPPSQNPYTHQPRAQYVQPPLSQNPHAEVRIQFVHSLPPQNSHAEPHVQHVQRPPRQNPHAEPHVQHFQRPPPPNALAKYMQRPPQNPYAEPHVHHVQQPPKNSAPEPQMQYVQPPQSSTAPVIYVQPPPQGGTNTPSLWASSLYSCTEDTYTCCLTLWCPCVTFGQIAAIVDEGSPSCIWSGGIHGVLCFVGIVAAVLAGWPCLTGLGWCYSCSYRTKMRAKYNLAETPCTDCVVHWCCDPCALCQEYKELQHRGFDPALGWKRNAEKQKQGAMTPPANQTMAK